jgi:hypothetical protein
MTISPFVATKISHRNANVITNLKERGKCTALPGYLLHPIFAIDNIFYQYYNQLLKFFTFQSGGESAAIGVFVPSSEAAAAKNLPLGLYRHGHKTERTPMQRIPKPDPYDGFKDDRERRRALNTRVRSYAIAMMVMALAGAPINWMEKIRWLKTFLL